MRILFLIFLSFCSLLSFELVLNTGRENDQAFAILHAKNDQEFTCFEFRTQEKPYFECEIPGIVDNELKDQSFSAFDLRFVKEERKIKLFIYPKIAAKIFDLSQDLYADEEIVVSKSRSSKSFTFVFWSKFPKEQEYDGLNFSVDFPHQILPYVGALDLNSDPVVIPQSADINTYLRIKDEYEKGNYSQVIIDAQNAIKRYKGSIFVSEFMLYKLRAADKIYNDSLVPDQQNLTQMIDEAKNWTRTFTSDKNFHELLYIMLRTYISLHQRTDVEHTMQILENEYTQNYFTQLARFEFADYLYALGEKEQALKIYEDTYFSTTNLDLAARASMSLAKDLLLHKQADRAIGYVENIFKADPTYFGTDIARSLDLAKLFYENGNFDVSAKIYENTFARMPKIDPLYESTLKDLALALEKSSRAKEAKKYIDQYMDEFLDGKFLDEIRKADDSIFFALPDNNSSFLHKRYKELFNTYLNSDEELARKALDEDVKLYYKENDFVDILNLKDQIENLKSQNTLMLLEQSAINVLKDNLQKDDCIGASGLFEKFKNYEIAQKISNKKQMFECLIRTSQSAKALAYADQNFNEDVIYYGLKKAKLLLDNKQYAQSLKLAKDVSMMRILKSDEELFESFYLQFLSLLKLNDYNEAIRILQILEDIKMNYTMVEAYDALLNYAKEHNMQTTILNYAPKAINYQNLKGINLFSPNLEFLYLEALEQSARYEEALNVLKDLLKLKLNDEQKARALYMQSVAFEALKDVNSQKQSLNECLKLTENSNWQNLCRDKFELLKD